MFERIMVVVPKWAKELEEEMADEHERREEVKRQKAKRGRGRPRNMKLEDFVARFPDGKYPEGGVPDISRTTFYRSAARAAKAGLIGGTCTVLSLVPSSQEEAVGMSVIIGRAKRFKGEVEEELMALMQSGKVAFCAGGKVKRTEEGDAEVAGPTPEAGL